MRGTLEERFEAKTMPIPECGCLLWIGACDRGGYGMISLDGRNIQAHRIAWFLAYGQIPDGLHVLHKCDIRNCVRHEHLFLGTNAENVADKKNKNRCSRCTGGENGRAKLTDDLIRKIRLDQRTLKEIGNEYGIHLAQVSLIKRRESWRHVK